MGVVVLARWIRSHPTLWIARMQSQSPDAAGARSSTIINLGGYYNFSGGRSLLFSLGRSVHGESHRIGYLAMYWTW